ncbi:GRIP and coiled-coil domain-containing protein 2 [Hyalella azteca]|uniref:GRIP and coiled-coil domain-containing protein 2 n=1 Tax=Hyalella azteca TaxID=294128 RepID=A0A8B7P1S1_HYAAZ|nr:GRIP and coiled-coil domain-containing protein 2 [Hyalella azteca]
MSKRRVSLSRRHLQKQSYSDDIQQELLLPDAVHPDAYHSSSSTLGRSNDALLELDKLGMPRVSSLSESLDKLDHEESTDDDGVYLASPSPYGATTSEESSSLHEAGLLYELPLAGYVVPVQRRCRSSNAGSDGSFDTSSRQIYFSVKNSNASTPLSSSSTISLSSEVNVFQHYSDVVYPDQLYSNASVGVPLMKNNFEVRSLSRNGSSGESGRDTEGTVRAASDNDDIVSDQHEPNMKFETSRDLLESGFTEDFNPSVPSVYEEEAIINIERSIYQDSDSDPDDNLSARSRSRGGYTDQESCVSFSTNYPESQYQYGNLTKFSESSYSSDLPFQRDEHGPKKSNLVRRPHVKAAESPLLKRKGSNKAISEHDNLDKSNMKTNKKTNHEYLRPGEMELELERPQRDNVVLMENKIADANDSEDRLQYFETENENGISEHEREKTSLEFMENFEKCEAEVWGTDDLRGLSADTEVIDTDTEYCNIMEKTMNLEVTKTKWAKTKEQILKLLKERLLILKKIIQDKNSQIRQLKTRLKIEQQNSQAMAEKLKERERPALPSTVTAEVAVLKRQLTTLRQEKAKLRQELMQKEVKLKEASKEIINKTRQEERWKKTQLQERRRESARETKTIAELRKTLKHMEKECGQQQKAIHKLENEKIYLGERLYKITGVEESFWSDHRPPRAPLTPKEVTLVRQKTSLSCRVSQLQTQCRDLDDQNTALRKMELSCERSVDRTRQQELLKLKRKNTELASMTKQLEDKVRNLEKKSQLLPTVDTNGVAKGQRWGASGPRKQQSEEAFSQQLQKRDAEIERLKLRMKELVYKLTSKNGKISQAQSNLELEHIIRTVTRERLQLERQVAAVAEGQQRQNGAGSNGSYTGAHAGNGCHTRPLGESGEAVQCGEYGGVSEEGELQYQLQELDLLTRQHHTLQKHVQEKDLECVTLKDKLKLKNELCQDLPDLFPDLYQESQLAKVIEKNTELTLQNSDLQKQIQNLQNVNTGVPTSSAGFTQGEGWTAGLSTGASLNLDSLSRS